MLDIKRIRNDFDEVAKKLATRGVAAEKLAELKEKVKMTEDEFNAKKATLLEKL